MRNGVFLLLLLMAACGPGRGSRASSTEERILEKYARANSGGSVSSSSILSRLPENLRFRLQIWQSSKLNGANVLSTLEMEKRTKSQISWIKDQLELYKRPGGQQAETLREKLLSDLELEAARLAMLQGHLPIAGLPMDEQEKLAAWRRSALVNADSNSLAEMRRAAARRIAWLEKTIKELHDHQQDVVWQDYLHYSLLLRFEVLKLGHIEEQLNGRG